MDVSVVSEGKRGQRLTMPKAYRPHMLINDFFFRKVGVALVRVEFIGVLRHVKLKAPLHVIDRKKIGPRLIRKHL